MFGIEENFGTHHCNLMLLFYKDKMKLLLLVHSDYYTDDLNQCKSFNTVIAWNLKNEFTKRGIDCHVVPSECWMGIKKQLKSTWDNFDKNFDKSLLNEYDNVLFVGAISLKHTHHTILDFFRKNVKGMFGAVNEGKREAPRDALFFMMPEEESHNQIHIGPLFNEEYLYPEKQYENLILHIDHHYPGRGDWSEDIKKLIIDLEKNEFFNTHWNNYEVYYHTEKLNSIDDFDYYNPPSSIPFTELSKIYRQVHIGFVSHRETLGMYPIEMAATGAMLATIPKIVKPAMLNYFNHVNYHEDFWNTILPLINPEQEQENVKKISGCSYSIGADKILPFLK